MKTNRRDFLKKVGLAGITLTGSGMLGCTRQAGDSSGSAAAQAQEKDWRADPRWRQVKYGDWSGPGVPSGPGPMDHVFLKDYAPRSSVVADKTTIPKARYPVIDAHIHHYPGQGGHNDPEQALADWVTTMDEVGIEQSVVLTGATGDAFDHLVQMYLEPYPDRFQLYCGVESSGIDQPDYPDRAVAELERCYKRGARGIGEVTDKGFGITRDRSLAPEDRLHPDDDRLDAFWKRAGELNLPVNIHIADHPSAWQAPDVFQERTPIFQQFNQHGREGLSYEELLPLLPSTLRKHPDTTFIACHLANLGNDLGRLAGMLDEHDNLYVDISARDYEVGRQPRGAAKFMNDYQDRVLFGTDMGMDRGMYQAWWRLLESDDEHMTGRVWWRYYGLDLPDPVLESLYRANAQRLMNWESV